ncbi:MAG: hypothetical protein QGI45_00360 [Myxococcota bacterium]|jgi:hypothetical protein|nr:hypothetical protein [Myxococcota bacterium]
MTFSQKKKTGILSIGVGLATTRTKSVRFNPRRVPKSVNQVLQDLAAEASMRVSVTFLVALFLVSCATYVEAPPGDQQDQLFPSSIHKGNGSPEDIFQTEVGVYVPTFGDDLGGNGCVSDLDYFAQDVWQAFMSTQCFACHNASGLASGTDLVLKGASESDYLQDNFNIVKNISTQTVDDVSILLLKPTNQLNHGGGERFGVASSEYGALQELLGRFAQPTDCISDPPIVDPPFLDYFAVLEQSELTAALRKATLNLVGRLPEAQEVASVENAGEDAFRAVLENILSEEAFFDRLKELYNDIFLTDRYISGNQAANLLNAELFPNRMFYNDLDPTVDDPAWVEAAQDYTNKSIAREPLDLIAHVVREGRPFHEILTADYMLVNPFSAISYGFDEVSFVDQLDPTEFKEVQLDTPHAGLLSSVMFLRRFPSTNTNRNRHRAYVFYKKFLGIDVLEFDDQDVDPSAISGFNPTMFNAGCASCHDILDPVAGTFQNRSNSGRYRLTDWYVGMQHPGIDGTLLPMEETHRALPWLVEQVATDERFALQAVRTLYQGLTGQEPLRVPEGNLSPDAFAAQMLAFNEEAKVFQGIKDSFVADNYNLKTLIKELILSPYFRALALEDEVESELELAHAQTGSARLLTPEMLHRKMEATLNFPWVHFNNQRSKILSRGDFLYFYGGINSNTITKRMTEPNGIIASVSTRMANEMACSLTAFDFTRDASERMLFPYVEHDDAPVVDNIADPLFSAAAKTNIRYLFKRLLGEDLALSDPEVESTYQLFNDVWLDGQQGMANDTYSENLTYACRGRWDRPSNDLLPEELRISGDETYSIRSWMAVLTYLLSDYFYLYE